LALRKLPGQAMTDVPKPLVSELIEVVKAFVQQEVEYMTINHLGDPEKQHNVKWARAVLAKAGAKQP
jgi:hypothetical protein